MVKSILRHKTLFLLPCIVAIAVAAIVCLRTQYTYEAQSSIYINPPEGSSNNIQADIKKLAEQTDDISIAQSEIHLYTISCSGGSPNVICNNANAMSTQYVDMMRSRYLPDYSKKIKALETQWDKLSKQLKEKEDQFAAFQQNNRSTAPDTGATEKQIQERQLELTKQEMELDNLKQEAKLLAISLANTPEKLKRKKTEKKNPKAELIQQEIYKLELERDGLLLKFTEKHPQVKALGEKIQLYSKQLKTTSAEVTASVVETSNPEYLKIKAELSANNIKIERLQAQIAIEQERLKNMTSAFESAQAADKRTKEELNSLLAERDSLKEEHNNVIAEINALNTKQKEEETDVLERFKILQRAVIPKQPMPNYAGVISLGIVLAGIALGTIFSVSAHKHNSTLRTAEQAEAELGIPVLGSIASIVVENNSR